MSDARLIEGDCLDVMRGMPSGSFGLVVTSPPYNLGASPWPHLGHWKPGAASSGSDRLWRGAANSAAGVAYGGHDDAMPHADYVRWQREVLAECWRLLRDDGAIFYNHKPRVVGDRLWLPLELNPDLPLRQVIVWARGGGVNYRPTAFVPTHEWVLLLAKPGFRLRDRSASAAGDVWSFPEAKGNPHPAPFPVELPARVLRATRPDLGPVLDPFCGSGTTLVACLKAGRPGVGIESDPSNVAYARRRIAAAETPLLS